MARPAQLLSCSRALRRRSTKAMLAMSAETSSQLAAAVPSVPTCVGGPLAALDASTCARGVARAEWQELGVGGAEEAWLRARGPGNPATTDVEGPWFREEPRAGMRGEVHAEKIPACTTSTCDHAACRCTRSGLEAETGPTQAGKLRFELQLMAAIGAPLLWRNSGVATKSG